MASLSKRGSGYVLRFEYGDKRWTVTLPTAREGTSRGKVQSERTAELRARRTAGHVQTLIDCRMMGAPVDSVTLAWLDQEVQSGRLRARLEEAGLIPKAEREDATTLGGFLGSYLEHKQNVKPATRVIWGNVIRNLGEHFGQELPIADITEGDADDFKEYLLGQGLAKETVRKRLQLARQFFNYATRKKLIPANPFQDVSLQKPDVSGRRRFIDRETIDRILEVSDPTWQTIICLSRYGGLRCPSEVLSLRWEHVDFNRRRIIVDSPKTEHHDGKAQREIPLFEELLAPLSDAFDRAEDGAVYVIGRNYRAAALGPNGWQNCNLRTQFLRLLKRAGVTPWPRIWHNLRSTRTTELLHEHPIHVCSKWLGESVKVMAEHYAQVIDADYDRAALHRRSTIPQKSRSTGAPAGSGTEGNDAPEVLAIPGETAVFAGNCTDEQWWRGDSNP